MRQASGKAPVLVRVPRSTQAVKSACQPVCDEKAAGLTARTAWRARVRRLARARDISERIRALVSRRVMRRVPCPNRADGRSSYPIVDHDAESATELVAHQRAVG